MTFKEENNIKINAMYYVSISCVSTTMTFLPIPEKYNVKDLGNHELLGKPQKFVGP